MVWWLWVGLALAQGVEDECVSAKIWEDLSTGWSVRSIATVSPETAAQGVQLSLVRGTRYHVFGCTRDGQAVDLGLYDPNGFRMGSGSGALAEIEHESASSGFYVLRGMALTTPLTVAVTFR